MNHSRLPCPLPAVFERSVLVSNGFVHEAILSRTEPRTAELVKEGIDLSQASVDPVKHCVGVQWMSGLVTN